MVRVQTHFDALDPEFERDCLRQIVDAGECGFVD